MRFIYYDTETTGLNFKKDRIIEIAAYDPYNNKSFATLINPQMEIPKESIAICNITNDMVNDAPYFKEAINDFANFCEGEVLLIAHNNDAFDKLFLEEEGSRSSFTLPSNWKFLDSLKWARKYRPDLPRHSLQYLREIYGIKKNQAHRALDDVMVLYQVFSSMIDDLDVKTVIELMEKNKNFCMPFGKHQGKPLKSVPAHYISWLNKNGAFDREDNQKLKEECMRLGILK